MGAVKAHPVIWFKVTFLGQVSYRGGGRGDAAALGWFAWRGQVRAGQTGARRTGPSPRARQSGGTPDGPPRWERVPAPASRSSPSRYSPVFLQQ